MRRARMVPGGPLLVEGPLEITMPSGEMVRSDRFMVAVCMCRRSATYPLCDTSHRTRRPRVARNGGFPRAGK
ncbi:CDGSH iron-sulfur domain-containing protein [Tomitella cavernea]|uniref:CDGSH iron-sulfur domain-containing protein n=1 Tax=Tomitella cavernea TaxID=1387982 RepID=A0ABP9CSU7_9ACTN